MKQQSWRVLLVVVSVLLVFGVVHALRRPAASDGAQRIAVGAGGAPADEKGTDARFQKAMASLEANEVQAADELQRRQLETAAEAQRMKQQEAITELQRRQQQASRPLSAHPGLSVEAVGLALVKV